MTEKNGTTPGPTPDDRTGAIARSAAAVIAGLAVGYSARDVSLGITTAGAALSLLREAFIRPTR